MLYDYLAILSDSGGVLNLFRYLTFRSGGALITAFLLALLMGKPVIRWLKHVQKEGQPIREDGPEGHLLTKKGTPTMGGVMILIALVISSLLWASWKNPFVWSVLLVTVGFGALGFADDYAKLTKRSSSGIAGKMKLLGQIVISAATCWWIAQHLPEGQSSHLALPFFKDLLIDLGWFFIPFTVFVMVGASNAVNLTDGLDGLATVPVMIAAACFAFISYLVGNAVFSDYLQLHFVPGAGEIAVVCAATVGAAMGFLWYNAPPAQVFMGDTGSLSLGGMLGAVSVITKHEIVLAIIGGLFVIETLSVIIQVYYYKLTGGKRIFLMAPIHHHFEKKGWSEPTIVIRFWIVACLFALAGLATLKLR